MESPAPLTLRELKESIPAVLDAMNALAGAAGELVPDKAFLHLVQLRASQMNGCAMCVQVHTNELRAAGCDQARIDQLPAWYEANVYTDKERAALAWAEAVTGLANRASFDAEYLALQQHCTTQEIVALTAAVSAINVWNRMARCLRLPAPPAKGMPHA